MEATTLIISLYDVKRSEDRGVRQDEAAPGRYCLIMSGMNGGAYRIRTDDILLAKQALYQLS